MPIPQIVCGPEVTAKFAAYPATAREKLKWLRQLIIEAATETGEISRITESLKWGEPSYATAGGSPIRMDWKARAPEQYALYFNCSTNLVETFRMLHGPLFRYEKNRALLFDLHENPPIAELKQCLTMALRYHHLKHLPLLGE